MAKKVTVKTTPPAELAEALPATAPTPLLEPAGYAQSPQDEPALIRAATEIRCLAQQSAAAIIRMGQLLLEAKERVAHGQWGAWLDKEVDCSVATANRAMATAKRFSDVPAVQALPISKVYELLQAPEEAVAELAESAAEMSVRDLRGEIDRLRAEKELEGAELRIELAQARQATDDARQEAGVYEDQVKDLFAQMQALRQEAALAAQSEAAALEREEHAREAAAAARRTLEAIQDEAHEVREVTVEREVPPADYEALKEADARAQAEVAKAQAETEQAQAEAAAAQQKLDKLKARLALPSNLGNMQAISAKNFARAVSVLCTEGAALPYMGKLLATLPEAMRSSYRVALEHLQIYLTAALAAVDGIELEVEALPEDILDV